MRKMCEKYQTIRKTTLEAAVLLGGRSNIVQNTPYIRR